MSNLAADTHQTQHRVLDVSIARLIESVTLHNKLVLDKIVHVTKNYRPATAAGFLADHTKRCLAAIEEVKMNLPSVHS